MWEEGAHIYGTPGVHNNFPFRAMINNPFKESFYEKKINNVLTVFFIFHKRYVKIFLK